MIELQYNIPKELKKSTNSIYSWIHWTKRKKIADYYHNIVYQDCQDIWRLDKKINLTFKFYWKSRVLDSSNCSFMWKCLEDWLVKGWIVEDDNNQFIWTVSYESVELTKAQRKTLKEDTVIITIN